MRMPCPLELGGWPLADWRLVHTLIPAMGPSHLSGTNQIIVRYPMAQPCKLIDKTMVSSGRCHVGQA